MSVHFNSFFAAFVRNVSAVRCTHHYHQHLYMPYDIRVLEIDHHQTVQAPMCVYRRGTSGPFVSNFPLETRTHAERYVQIETDKRERRCTHKVNYGKNEIRISNLGSLWGTASQHPLYIYVSLLSLICFWILCRWQVRIYTLYKRRIKINAFFLYLKFISRWNKIILL